MTGPVQVLVVGLEQPTFSGEVMGELDRLRQAGTVRLLDVLLVARAEDGTFETLPFPASAPADMGTLVARILGGSDAGLTSAAEQVDGPTWSLADAIPVGATAAVTRSSSISGRRPSARRFIGPAAQRSTRPGWPRTTSSAWIS